MRKFPFATWITAAVLPAQTLTVLPAVCAHAPGNAAIAMPLHWSQGTMQVLVERTLLPAALSQISGIRMRRPGRDRASPGLRCAAADDHRAGRLHHGAGRAAGCRRWRAIGRPGWRRCVRPGKWWPSRLRRRTATATPPRRKLFAVQFTAPLAGAGHRQPAARVHRQRSARSVSTPATGSTPSSPRVAPMPAYAAPLGNGGCSPWSASLQLDWQGSSPPLRGHRRGAAAHRRPASRSGVRAARARSAGAPVERQLLRFRQFRWRRSVCRTATNGRRPMRCGAAPRPAAGAWSFGFAVPASATVRRRAGGGAVRGRRHRRRAPAWPSATASSWCSTAPSSATTAAPCSRPAPWRCRRGCRSSG